MSSSSPLTPSDVLKRKSPAIPALQKGVEIVDEPDEIIPPPVYDDEVDRSGSSSVKHHRASISGKKMTGRPPPPQTWSSSSLPRKTSNMTLSGSDQLDSSSLDGSQTDAKKILSQVTDWLQQEKAKRSRKKKKKGRTADKNHALDEDDEEADRPNEEPAAEDSDFDLSSLEGILAGYIKSASSTPRLLPKASGLLSRRGSIAKKLKRSPVSVQSSDTEFFGDEVLVPNVEANLDNTKTLAYSGGAAETEGDGGDKARKKDQKHWNTFKQEILRLTHTLRLKGWRRIPMEQGGELEVARLSGALTNAVYVVKPPKQLHEEKVNGLAAATPKRRPMNLLLRIYGPQVEHLIDRGEELAILKRLARKKIGPRMLGTFLNGRFEEYLHAKTLESHDLRVSETSKQIAKRMRELHDGIELLDAEIESGPTAFLNWDKWVDRCETVITWLDKQVHDADVGKEPKPKAKYTRLGLICGVEWPLFRQTYDRYRAQLLEECGGESSMRKKLVFAHNDTQYGNLMRLQPAGESPLLQPSNQHKQLVVIDFEYAGQNTAGYEFANHFSEWTYNYHHAEKPFACNHKQYPTPEEQRRFVRSYVMHRPQFNPSASATPKMDGREKTNISDFILDARAPPGGAGPDYDAEENAREEKMDKDIERLLHETRLWRIACSASWVAWGIVQAQVPELDEPPRKSIASSVMAKVKSSLHPQSDPLDKEEQEHKEAANHDRPEGRAQEEAHHEGDEEHDDEFDYLAYAQERAMLFWGDCLQMGLVRDEDMPEGTRKMLKTVQY